jgi:putative transposase
LKSKLLRWIVDDYHVRFHEGLRGFPINEWQKRMPEDGVDAVPRFESIREFLGAAHLKPIGKKGVALYGHYYFHPELKQIRRDRGPKQRYEIRSDPYDIGAIELLTPDGQWLRVWSDRPELTVGVSMHQSEVHDRLAKKLALKGEAVTDAYRLEALERAQAESAEIMGDGKGKTTVRNVARYHHDNGVFMTPVAGQSGGRAANDDNLTVSGGVDEEDGVAVTDREPEAASRTAPERRAKAAKVAADETVGAEEFAAYQAQRKAAMRRAG